MRMSREEVLARKNYYKHYYYINHPEKWLRSGDDVICKCRRGYGSSLDGLCRCCRLIDAKRGFKMIMEQLEQVVE